MGTKKDPTPIVVTSGWEEENIFPHMRPELVNDYDRTCAYALPICVAVVDKVGYIARVDGISMQPSLNPVPGLVDFVVLNKWAVRNYDIARGDIISLISPKNPGQRFIKRVVGLEGDVIPSTGYKTSMVTIPQGHCWVEGDHLGSSLDSNTFGPVALGLVTAKATHIVWPPSRWRSLRNSTPVEKKQILHS